ncbi:hypothetical protein N9L68_07295 [bacterium]|nr:hypothetical protein [bacterium]
MFNVMTHLRPGHGKAIERTKKFIDKGRDPEDARRGVTADRVGLVSGPTLVDLTLDACEHYDEDVDIDQPGSMRRILGPIFSIGSRTCSRNGASSGCTLRCTRGSRILLASASRSRPRR